MPRALIRPPRHPSGAQPRGQRGAGAEGPDTQFRRGLEGGDTGAEGYEVFSPLSQRASAPGTRGHRCREVRTGWPAAGPLDAQVPRALTCDGGTTRHTWREDLPNDQLVRWYWQLMRSVRWGWTSILLPSAAEGSCPVELGNPPILALILLA